MTKWAHGLSHRTGISFLDAAKMFSTELKAERWFIEKRWGGRSKIRCPFCESRNILRCKTRKPQPFRCRNCRKLFSVKTDTLMHSSNIPLSKWGIAIYLYSTNLKGPSSMNLHRELGITQKSAWYMAHRIREAWDNPTETFAGPVEVDEAYIGGREGNKHEWKKQNAGRGPVGKAAVADVKDRETNRIAVLPVDRTDAATLQNFVHERTKPDTMVLRDEARAYDWMRRAHQRAMHIVKKFVNGKIHTNGMESYWSMLKRACVGVDHHMNRKRLGRYANEFAGMHNVRQMDTEAQMAALVRGSVCR